MTHFIGNPEGRDGEWYAELDHATKSVTLWECDYRHGAFKIGTLTRPPLGDDSLPDPDHPLTDRLKKAVHAPVAWEVLSVVRDRLRPVDHRSAAIQVALKEIDAALELIDE